MTEISRTALFGKLNSLAYQTIESATVFCKMRGNPYVELVHWLHQILEQPNSDLHQIINHFSLDYGCLAKDLIQALDRLPRGTTSLQDFSSHVEEAVERGWVYGSLMFEAFQIRTGYLVIGILKTRGLKLALEGISSEFQKIRVDDLTGKFSTILESSPEDQLPPTGGSGPVDAGAAPGLGKQEALNQFSVDLTKKARNGELDPVVARDSEIRQIVDILMRRRQNNPILTGEAGVGKTAVVEGFALHIAAGDVPPPLENVTLRVLDVGLLQAGASYKGEFEKRLHQVIDEVQASEKPIILFIDEAHTLIGAGGSAGTGDAANLLKPALARGTLRTIAATTWAEYKKYIEKDPALTRRFQVVQIHEPGEEDAVRMMRSMASVMEGHHKVKVLDEALAASVTLSHRYIPARQLPDKSISLLDTACARAAISQHAVPAEVDNCRKTIAHLETELEIIQREASIGIKTGQREPDVLNSLETEKERLGRLEERWQAEKEVVEKILSLQQTLQQRSDKADPSNEEIEEKEQIPAQEDVEDLRTELSNLINEMRELQGDNPLILPTVDFQAVAAVVGDWTGIPVGRMMKNEISTVLSLSDIIGRRIIGQDHALEMIAKRIQTSRASLDNPQKPIGVFMLAGPSGVGKTETALALAEALYGGEQNVVTINMSEFQESHTVSTLKGAPPGYVGYGEGGVLTEAVRRKPYSVILLDEVEKAHPDVHEIFFQVFDKGWMEDGEGRLIDFKNTLILLTTNVGSDLIMNMCKDPDLMPLPEGMAKSLRKPMLDVFPAALLGRLITIPYYPLSDEVLGRIITLQLGRIEKRIRENHKIPFTYDEAVISHIISRCTELESGGRMIDSILTNTVLPSISRRILEGILDGKPIADVHIREEKGEFAYRFNEAQDEDSTQAQD